MASRLAYTVAFEALREVLVLDEIFAVGDVGFRAKCEERYWRLKREGHSILIVTHDPRIALEFCDRVILVEAGRIAADGSPQEVWTGYEALMQERARTGLRPA